MADPARAVRTIAIAQGYTKRSSTFEPRHFTMARGTWFADVTGMPPRIIAGLMILCAASQASAQELRLPGAQNSARNGPLAVSFLPVDPPEQPTAARSVLFTS